MGQSSAFPDTPWQYCPPPLFLSWIKQTAKFYHSSRTSLYILTTCFSPVTRFHRTNLFGTGMNGQIGINIKQFGIIRFVDMQILTRCTFFPPFFLSPQIAAFKSVPWSRPSNWWKTFPSQCSNQHGEHEFSTWLCYQSALVDMFLFFAVVPILYTHICYS